MDIVLNSLAGELTDAGLSLLVEGGRFLEMGKTDIRDPKAVAQKYPDVLYRPFDIMPLTVQEPAYVQAALTEAADRIANGELKPLPYRSCGWEYACGAFRYMAQGKHIGKVVLTLDGTEPSEEVRVPLAETSSGQFVIDARVLSDDPVEQVHSLVEGVLRHIQEWLQSENLNQTSLLVVTQDAMNCGDQDSVVGAAGAAGWGLVRSIRNENPSRSTACLTLGPKWMGLCSPVSRWWDEQKSQFEMDCLGAEAWPVKRHVRNQTGRNGTIY